MRHATATISLRPDGLPVKVVSECLGHANEVVTLTIYAHVIPGQHRDAADRIGALFAAEQAAGTRSS